MRVGHTSEQYCKATGFNKTKLTTTTAYMYAASVNIITVCFQLIIVPQTRVPTVGCVVMARQTLHVIVPTLDTRDPRVNYVRFILNCVQKKTLRCVLCIPHIFVACISVHSNG